MPGRCAVTEYFNEIRPKAKLLPAYVKSRTHRNAICGEMRSGFASLRVVVIRSVKYGLLYSHGRSSFWVSKSALKYATYGL